MILNGKAQTRTIAFDCVDERRQVTGLTVLRVKRGSLFEEYREFIPNRLVSNAAFQDNAPPP